MGVDSGLPDFRGTMGFWRAYPALGQRGLGFTDVATPRAFHADPRLAWGFYGHRLGLYRRTRPHDGFGLLLDWASRKPHGIRVFTSNVDGQFQAAGFDPDWVSEYHGSIHALQCLAPCSKTTWMAADFDPVVDEAACQLRSPLPRCPHCGGLARPNVLMFDDSDWIEIRPTLRADLDRWVIRAMHPVVLEIGAGTAVPSVRLFTARMHRLFGARIVRINPGDATVAEGSGIGLAMGALQALRAIDVAMADLLVASTAFKNTTFLCGESVVALSAEGTKYFDLDRAEDKRLQK